MSEEYSKGGSRIYRHSLPEKKGWTLPDMSATSNELIDQHIEKHLGKIETVYHEALSDIVHIDVHLVAPNASRPYYTLVTSGMSDLPMNVPEEIGEYRDKCRYTELMICLPATWPLTEEDLKHERNFWPIRWLKFMARFPHEFETWLWEGHTIPNGNPASPFADNTRLACMMITCPMTIPEEFWSLEVSTEKTIHFFALMPLYRDEMNLKLKKGTEYLLELFKEKQYTELLDPQRKSVVKRPWYRLF